MMACTPSALRQNNQSTPSDLSALSNQSIPSDLNNLSNLSDLNIPELPDSLRPLLHDSLPFTLNDSVAKSVDSLAKKDTVVISDQSLLTTIDNFKEAAAKVKRDTTTMDSLELAVYKHNKAVDDSLALDSINRSRKSGIDSPV